MYISSKAFHQTGRGLKADQSGVEIIFQGMGLQERGAVGRGEGGSGETCLQGFLPGTV